MGTLAPLQQAIKSGEITTENKCSYCINSTCCNYVTQQIDAPRSIDDFDTLLWQVSHEFTQLYKDDDGWFLLLNNKCVHLKSNGDCGIYDKRPLICREHSNEDCEFGNPAGADDFDLFFPDYKSLDKYCRKRFKSWDKRFQKQKSNK